MKLTQLAREPQLIKLTIDDEIVIKEYGEPIEFWIYDRQPLDKFLKIAQLRSDKLEDTLALVKDMILDEDGKPILVDNNTLPLGVLGPVMNKVVETLGK